jgi:hypothetical protein
MAPKVPPAATKFQAASALQPNTTDVSVQKA